MISKIENIFIEYASNDEVKWNIIGKDTSHTFTVMDARAPFKMSSIHDILITFIIPSRDVRI